MSKTPEELEAERKAQEAAAEAEAKRKADDEEAKRKADADAAAAAAASAATKGTFNVTLTDAQRTALLAGEALDLSEEQYTGGVRQQMDVLKRRATAAERRLAEIAAAQEETERKALEEQEKFKELYEKERQKGEALTVARKDDLIRSRFLLAAQSKGAVDPDTAFLVAKGLAGFGAVQVSDEGAVSGVDELVDALKTEKSYLFSSADPKKQSVGSPTNPGQPDASAPKSLAEAGDRLEQSLRKGV